MYTIYHRDGRDYHLDKNKNNSVTLFDTDAKIPLLTFTTDYKVIEVPSCEQIGKFTYEGEFLVFKPNIGKIIRPMSRSKINPETIEDFQKEIARWWLNNNMKDNTT